MQFIFISATTLIYKPFLLLIAVLSVSRSLIVFRNLWLNTACTSDSCLLQTGSTAHFQA